MPGTREKFVVVGAGPVGSLAALYAAQRGHVVEVYELRNDLRDPSTTPLNFTKSINLALSERGIQAIVGSGYGTLLDQVFDATIPVRGRMIHGRTPTGALYETAQDYDVRGRTIFAIDRAGLNGCLLDALEEMPNVRVFFNHKLTGADFRRRKAWFERNGPAGTRHEIEVDFDFLMGADGAHSAVRYHLMKYVQMDYQQTYIDTLWCEFRIEPRSDNGWFAISPNHLHIWPGRLFMFIAIPSTDGSFTCTLFLPSAEFARLEAQPADALPAFFDQHFPGVTGLIAPANLVDQFRRNPHLPLISINCRPYHFQSSAVILGDAAHAMVPFYGQGMNAGLEDVRVLFSLLDKHAIRESNRPDGIDGDESDQARLARARAHQAEMRDAALAEYSLLRVPDAHAINELALQNYIEMRASVLSPTYRLRKFLEEQLSVHMPWFGWQTKYARVSFGNERYSDVVRQSEFQGRVLLGGFVGVLSVQVITGLIILLRSRCSGARGGHGLLQVVAGHLKDLAGWLAHAAKW